MSRDLSEKGYYRAAGGQVPIKWTAPEVGYYLWPKALSVHPRLLMSVCESVICHHAMRVVSCVTPCVAASVGHGIQEVHFSL